MLLRLISALALCVSSLLLSGCDNSYSDATASNTPAPEAGDQDQQTQCWRRSDRRSHSQSYLGFPPHVSRVWRIGADVGSNNTDAAVHFCPSVE